MEDDGYRKTLEKIERKSLLGSEVQAVRAAMNEIDQLRTDLKDSNRNRESDLEVFIASAKMHKDNADIAERILAQCAKIIADVVPSTECLTVDLTTLVEKMVECQVPCLVCHPPDQCPDCKGKKGDWSRWDCYPDEWNECRRCKGTGKIKL